MTRAAARHCHWCRAELTATQARWCSRRCRQTAYRARKLAAVEGRSHGTGETAMRLAYADPPYPGCAHYYRDQLSYGGEVDHEELVGRLATYDGWALSTSRSALPLVLSLAAARDAIVCPWVKVHGASRARGPSNVHEYLLVRPARRRLPGVPDALVAAVARGGDSGLIGRKPIRFVHWMLALLGAEPCDTLDDLYPGSGIVGRCWEEFRRRSTSATGPGGAVAESSSRCRARPSETSLSPRGYGDAGAQP